MATWYSETPPPEPRAYGLAGWLRIVVRGLAILLVLLVGLACLLALRLVEAPLHAPRRPWTPHITQTVCRIVLRLIGLRRTVQGRPAAEARVVVANHVSWLDIFALNATQRVVFVAKSEVRGWAGIGWLARATGTLFVRRDRREAPQQQAALRERIAAGQPVLMFPEGTSTDGFRVLPFKTTLFAPLAGQARLEVQAVSVVWTAPGGADPRFYGWWGDMDFGSHMLTVLAAPRQGGVTLRYHPPVDAGGFPDRKALALHLERQTREGQWLAEGRSS
ncbi:lysophospholipid acyltransferase family protein [Frigidibacter sp. ROC022]|uniref:lysophospholipid acyltransferase family protein n=1 Tax=Frigidibacter sp. ROC022 TaxID=2971796 RepID=UPI00215AE196|nr:lysophospholipid acyltransferase family protein [Frigidibacter sp. ROC022]MCR8723932.1 1-acyl-sn-glycerol-3-phosphate acyltransferase [Frigidibacter sp. ROC022]